MAIKGSHPSLETMHSCMVRQLKDPLANSVDGVRARIFTRFAAHRIQLEAYISKPAATNNAKPGSVLLDNWCRDALIQNQLSMQTRVCGNYPGLGIFSGCTTPRLAATDKADAVLSNPDVVRLSNPIHPSFVFPFRLSRLALLLSLRMPCACPSWGPEQTQALDDFRD